jgi:hypothetical protein
MIDRHRYPIRVVSTDEQKQPIAQSRQAEVVARLDDEVSGDVPDLVMKKQRHEEHSLTTSIYAYYQGKSVSLRRHAAVGCNCNIDLLKKQHRVL